MFWLFGESHYSSAFSDFLGDYGRTTLNFLGLEVSALHNNNYQSLITFLYENVSWRRACFHWTAARPQRAIVKLLQQIRTFDTEFNTSITCRLQVSVGFCHSDEFPIATCSKVMHYSIDSMCPSTRTKVYWILRSIFAQRSRFTYLSAYIPWEVTTFPGTCNNFYVAGTCFRSFFKSTTM